MKDSDHMAFIAGVDEAGRGPVIGPLVICAFAIAEENEDELRAMGAKDSKLLTPKKREELFEKLKEYPHALVEISAEEITALMRKKVSLNEIEARFAGQALNELDKKVKIERVIIDSPDPVAQRFAERIGKHYQGKAKLIAEHYADKEHPSVSAASILAKVTRDALCAKIKKITGFDFGTGYPHDALALEFLKKFQNDKRFAQYIRHQWSTAKNAKSAQMDLEKFL